MRMVIAAALSLAACGESSSEAPTAAADNGVSPTVWEAHLTQMLPFIDACVARSPDTRAVSFAAPTGEALVTVRLAGPSGNIDCTVPDDDPTPTYAVISPRRDEWQPTGEGAIFVRGPGANPGGECYEAEEVRNADGQVIGWMVDPDGC